ncbi:MAG: DNA-formamidopyrimidine glycosylase family protein [Acidimicrobiales bacterium]
MPELVEVEVYRQLAETVVGRRITEVSAPDAWYLKRGLDATTVTRALVGTRFVAARRTGKLLLLDGARTTLGLRFGMSGRLVVDGRAAMDDLLYSSNAAHPRFDRFAVRFARGELVMRDPRRLGGVELDPVEERLGPDALHITTAQLRRALGGSSAPLKARLMDQSHIAGVGNLAADELLWRVGLDPGGRAGALSDADTRRLASAIRSTLGDLMRRGGSHTGDLMAARVTGGRCPRDGGPLVKRTIGGRTTWSCPVHQL